MCSSIAHISVIQTGTTPLYTASQHGHTDVVDTLIRAGVSVNQACMVWSTAVYSDCMWCELSFAVLRISCPQPLAKQYLLSFSYLIPIVDMPGTVPDFLFAYLQLHNVM